MDKITKITLKYPYESIRVAVEQESSLFSIRQKDEDKDRMFEELVYDKAYEFMFRQHFYNAQAELTDRMALYLHSVGEVSPFDYDDEGVNKDFEVELIMPEHYDVKQTKAADIQIRQFLTAYIMYQWLETKKTEFSAIYKERADALLRRIKRHLERRTVEPRRRGVLF